MSFARVLFRYLPLSALALASAANAQYYSLDSVMAELNRVVDTYSESFKDCLSEATLYTEKKWEREYCRSQLFKFSNDLQMANSKLHAWVNHRDLSPEDNARVRRIYDDNLDTIKTAKEVARRYG